MLEPFVPVSCLACRCLSMFEPVCTSVLFSMPLSRHVCACLFLCPVYRAVDRACSHWSTVWWLHLCGSPSLWRVPSVALRLCGCPPMWLRTSMTVWAAKASLGPSFYDRLLRPTEGSPPLKRSPQIVEALGLSVLSWVVSINKSCVISVLRAAIAVSIPSNYFYHLGTNSEQ